MNIQTIKNLATSKFARQILVAQKHSPTALFAAGVVGVVTTVVLSSRATLKLEEVVEEAQEKLYTAKTLHDSGHKDYSDQDYTQDVAVIYARAATKLARLYGPALIVGSVSVMALTGSHVILNRRNVALTAAYAALERGFNDYRKRVIGEFGEDKERELRHGIVSKEIVEEGSHGPEVKTISRVDPNTRSPYARFFDECSPSWNNEPQYNFIFLRAQQNYANDRLRARGHVFLNEVYDSLGIERTRAGAVVGWVLSKEGDNYVDFGIFDGNNPRARDFVNGRENSILLDFNVDGVIYDKI
jgi:hypothetical protein